MEPGQTIYTITVKGCLDPAWADLLGGMQITPVEGDPSATCLTGAVRDQAVLRGLVNRLWDLNLTITSLTCTQPAPAAAGQETGKISE